jgi:hypothetical protein
MAGLHPSECSWAAVFEPSGLIGASLILSGCWSAGWQRHIVIVEILAPRLLSPLRDVIHKQHLRVLCDRDEVIE